MEVKTCKQRARVRDTAVGGRCAQRGNHFADTSTRARQTIAELGARFVHNGSRVLVHGHSRVVLALLRLAVKQGIQFDVIVTEGRVRRRLRGFTVYYMAWLGLAWLGLAFLPCSEGSQLACTCVA